MTTATANQRRGSRLVSIGVGIPPDPVRRVRWSFVRGITRAMEWGVGPRVVRRYDENWVDRPYSRIKLEPFTEVIGAEVRGVDLRDPLDDEVRDEIRRALLEWKVLFFRDQHIDAAQHLAFAQ